MQFVPLHDGPHDSPSDLDGGEWTMIGLAVVVLVGILVVVWKLVQRRRYG